MAALCDPAGAGHVRNSASPPLSEGDIKTPFVDPNPTWGSSEETSSRSRFRDVQSNDDDRLGTTWAAVQSRNRFVDTRQAPRLRHFALLGAAITPRSAYSIVRLGRAHRKVWTGRLRSGTNTPVEKRNSGEPSHCSSWDTPARNGWLVRCVDGGYA